MKISINKRILFAGMAGLMAAACAAPAASTAAPTAAPAKPTEAAKPATGAQTNVEMYYPIAVGGPIAQMIDGYFGKFNTANPDVKATAVFAGSYQETLAKIQTTLQGGGKPPALAVLLSTDLWTLLDTNAIEPMDACLAKMGDAVVKDFQPAFMANSKDDTGKVWSIPFQRSTPVLYYNKAAFKEAGLDPDKPPQTWDALVDAAKKLTKPNGERWGIQIPSDGTPYWLFQSLAIGAGSNVFDSSTKVSFTKDAVVTALDNWVKLSKDAKAAPDGIVAWGTTPDAFLAGKAAMIVHTTGSLSNILNKATFDVGTAFIPGPKGFGVGTGGGNLYILKGAPQAEKDAACRVIQFLTQPENVAQWSIDTGYVASRKSAYDTQLMKDFTAKKPQYLVTRDQLQYAQAEISTHQGGQVQKILGDAVQAALTGKQSAKDALTEAQDKADKLLSQFK